MFNLIILFNCETNHFVDFIFELLKKHVKVLKHQFKQLNIGFAQTIIQKRKKSLTRNRIDFHCVQCHVLRWNSNINNKFLNEKQEEWKQVNQLEHERKSNMKKFQMLKEQWL